MPVVPDAKTVDLKRQPCTSGFIYELAVMMFVYLLVPGKSDQVRMCNISIQSCVDCLANLIDVIPQKILRISSLAGIYPVKFR